MRAGRGWMEGKSFLAFAREKKDRYRTGTQHPIFFFQLIAVHPTHGQWSGEWSELSLEKEEKDVPDQ